MDDDAVPFNVRPAHARESTVELYLKQRVRQDLNGDTLKLNVKGRRGWPDRLVILEEGEHDFVELKPPVRGVLKPLQQRVHAKLRRMGHAVYVLKNRGEVDAYIEAKLKQRTGHEITRDVGSAAGTRRRTTAQEVERKGPTNRKATKGRRHRDGNEKASDNV